MPGEHPDVLHARQTFIRRKINKLGGKVDEQNFTRRFVSAIEKQQADIYEEVISSYRSQLILGKPYTMAQLKEFLAPMYQSRMNNKQELAETRGFAAQMVCRYYCKKGGHSEQNRWTKARKKEQKKKTSDIKCWKCGKRGHTKYQCRSNKESNMGIAAIAKKNRVNTHSLTYIDSACSEHVGKKT